MDSHLDIAKVAGANIVAAAISLSGMEEGFRIFGLCAAAIYTCLKIAHLLKNWNERPSLSKKIKEKHGNGN